MALIFAFFSRISCCFSKSSRRFIHSASSSCRSMISSSVMGVGTYLPIPGAPAMSPSPALPLPPGGGADGRGGRGEGGTGAVAPPPCLPESSLLPGPGESVPPNAWAEPPPSPEPDGGGGVPPGGNGVLSSGCGGFSGKPFLKCVIYGVKDAKASAPALDFGSFNLFVIIIASISASPFLITLLISDNA